MNSDTRTGEVMERIRAAPKMFQLKKKLNQQIKGKLRRPRAESKTLRINQVRSSDSRPLLVRVALENH